MNYPKTRKAALKYFKVWSAFLDTTDNTMESLLTAINYIETTLQEFKAAFVEEDTINSPQNRVLASPWDDGILTVLELPKSADILEGLRSGTLK
jgi:hypothetical protein